MPSQQHSARRAGAHASCAAAQAAGAQGRGPGAAVGAWTLVVAVLLSWCLAAAAVWMDVAPSARPAPGAVELGTAVPEQDPGGAGGPATGEDAAGQDTTGEDAAGQDATGEEAAGQPDHGTQVVLVGIPGLTWDLVDEDTTPTLARLARGGGAAALVVRGTHEVTCPEDAWLTVGAGQRAATDLPGCGDAEGQGAEGQGAEETAATSGGDGTGGADEARWGDWQQAADSRALAPRLGSLARLAEAGGTCVAAYGEGAVIGAARPDGTVAVEVTADPGTMPAVAEAVGRASTGGDPCRIHLVGGPEVIEDDRSDVLPAVDAALDDLVQGVPEGTTVLVAGMGHLSGKPEAQVLVATPLQVRDGAGASLSSGSTRQQSLVQLTDLTPTLLRLAGVGAEDDALAGQPVTATPQVGDHVEQAADLGLGVSVAKWQAPWVLGALFALVLPLLVVALMLHGRGARPAREGTAEDVTARWRAAEDVPDRRGPAEGRHRIPLLAVVGTLAMAMPAATFLAGAVPWWRATQPWPAGVGAVLLGAILITALAWAGPWRRSALGPAAVVAAVTAIVLGVDVLWSARLGLVSVLGLQPVTAGRFYGQGNVGFGMFLGSVLVLFGVVLSWVRGRSAALAVGLLGVGAVVLNAAPLGGADFGGVPALAVATGLVLLAALGVRWTPLSLLVVAVGGGLVAAGALVADWLRGPKARTHLGDFVQSIIDGEAWGIVARKLDQSMGILVSYPVSWLAVLALVLVGWVVVRRPRWSAALWEHRGLWPVAVAALAALVLSWALNDSGIAAVALALTLLIAAAVTVLGRRSTKAR